MLRIGDRVPSFEVRVRGGGVVRYRDLWQRRHLLLVVLPDGAAGDRYAAHLAEHASDLTAHDTAMVVTGDPVAGVSGPLVLVADRWGEVHALLTAPPGGQADMLPDAPTLVEWLRYLQYQCPECQGETR
jgi:hypothetical protein